MPKIDQFRIAGLDERLSQIAERIEDIRQPIKPYHPGASDESAAVAMDDYIARGSVNGRLEKFILPGGDLAQWAADVVDAFGVDRFPVYSKGPPELELDVDSGASLPLLLTGVDDAVQAGLRITLWSAACQKPDLFEGARGDWNFRCCPMEKLFVLEGESYRPRTEPMKWVRSAFDQLVAEFNAEQAEDSKKTSPGGKDGKNSGDKKRRMTCNEANVRVADMLKSILKHKQKPSLRKLAEKIGCSKALVCGTPNWKAYQAKLDEIKQPKAVAFTDKLQQGIGEEDAELNKQIAEQTKDFEESPLVVNPKSRRPRRPKV